jgi:IS30 family transposase
VLPRYKYYPSIATAKAEKDRSVSRQGISLDAIQLAELNEMITPLIKDNKMSVEAACKACTGQVPISTQTLRRYIDKGHAGAIRLDLLSAPSRKVRKVSRPKVSHHLDDGRSFGDFESLEQDDKDNAWEMDTVTGSKKDRCRLLTLCHRDSGFLLIFKVKDATAESVVGILDYLEELLDEHGHAFEDLFGVLLTDNGSEFSDTQGMERSSLADKNRCQVYYCDPYSSWQKPHVEASHTYIRRILAKGQSFEGLTHGLVARICSHINSYPRASKDQVPFEWIQIMLPHLVLSELGIEKIDPKRVYLLPRLLDEK